MFTASIIKPNLSTKLNSTPYYDYCTTPATSEGSRTPTSEDSRERVEEMYASIGTRYEEIPNKPHNGENYAYLVDAESQSGIDSTVIYEDPTSPSYVVSEKYRAL